MAHKVENCGNCYYSIFRNLDNKYDTGECRRYAPKPTYLVRDKGVWNPVPVFAWPTVMQEKWCGEYKSLTP